jgi:hypothetical protein
MPAHRGHPDDVNLVDRSRLDTASEDRRDYLESNADLPNLRTTAHRA